MGKDYYVHFTDTSGGIPQEEWLEFIEDFSDDEVSLLLKALAHCYPYGEGNCFYEFGVVAEYKVKKDLVSYLAKYSSYEAIQESFRNFKDDKPLQDWQKWPVSAIATCRSCVAAIKGLRPSVEGSSQQPVEPDAADVKEPIGDEDQG